MSGEIDGRVILERAPAPHRRELRRMVAEDWTDAEILDAWRQLLPNFTERGENEVLAAAAHLRGEGTGTVKAPGHPLTQHEAKELIARHGSLRKAEKASNWSASHIARVAAGERGKP